MSTTDNNTIKAISLFSGMGGDSYGIKKAGLILEAYSEKEKKFRKYRFMVLCSNRY